MTLSDLTPENEALCRIAADEWQTTPMLAQDGDTAPLVMDIFGVRAGWIPESNWGVQSSSDGTHWFVIRGNLTDATSEPLHFLDALRRAWAYHLQAPGGTP